MLHCERCDLNSLAICSAHRFRSKEIREHNMETIFRIIGALIGGFGSAYLLLAAVSGIFFGFVWLVIKPVYGTRVVKSLLIALAFAPSLFGADRAAITIPAVFVMVFQMMARAFGAIAWSSVSILATWGLVLCFWNFAAREVESLRQK